MAEKEHALFSVEASSSDTDGPISKCQIVVQLIVGDECLKYHMATPGRGNHKRIIRTNIGKLSAMFGTFYGKLMEIIG